MSATSQEIYLQSIVPAAGDDAVAALQQGTTDTSEATAYGEAAACAAASTVAVQCSPIRLIRNLSWTDTQKDNVVIPSVSLFSIDLCLQERAGIYWEEPEPTELREKLGFSGPIVVLSAVVENADGEIKWPSLDFRPLGKKGHCSVWDGRGTDGFFVKSGLYRVKLKVAVGFYWDEAKATLKVPAGDPYVVSVVFQPKNADDLERAMLEAGDGGVGIGCEKPRIGHRIMCDTWLDIYRGGLPDSADAQLVAKQIDAHTETMCPGFFSTPKRDHNARYRSPVNFHPKFSAPYAMAVLGEMVQGVSRVLVSKPQPATPLQVNPPYKTGIFIHKGPEDWTSLASSQGCITIPTESGEAQVPFGDGLVRGERIRRPFGKLRNRQNVENPGDDYREVNRRDFLACLYSGFSAAEIVSRVLVTVRLIAPESGSAYDRFHRAPVAFYRWRFDWDPSRAEFITLTCRVHKALTVLKRVTDGGSEDLVVLLECGAQGEPITKWRPLLRYPSGTQHLEHALDPEKDYQESLRNHIYRLTIPMDGLPQDLQNACHAGNQVFVVLRVQYAWDWRFFDEDLQTNKWHYYPIVGSYPYLPPVAADGHRWDPVEWEFEIPEPIPSPVSDG